MPSLLEQMSFHPFDERSEPGKPKVFRVSARDLRKYGTIQNKEWAELAKDTVTESDLEQALMNHLQEFLLATSVTFLLQYELPSTVNKLVDDKFLREIK